MILTDEQKSAAAHEGNLALASCPGSGKTRTIVAKLLRSLHEVKQSTRLAACITYTNAGVDEIRFRLSRQLGRDECDDYLEVSTIHAFCLQNIFRPFHASLTPFASGYEVLPPEDERYHECVKGIIKRHALNSRAFDDFSLLQRCSRLPDRITKNAAQDFWDFLDSNGYVDFNGIVYYSSQIVQEDPFVPSALASKYAWILVDEFQDTSVYQTEILRKIHDYSRTRFFIVGDPEQSIMGFAGGRPDLMAKFSKEINARKDVSLSGNFRSSNLLVALAERLIPRSPQMQAVGDAKDFNQAPVWMLADDNFEVLAEHFLPWVREWNIDYGECAVLSPNIFEFFPVAPRVRDMGIPIIGPGARPYRRSNHLIAPVAEEVCSYVQSPGNKGLGSVRRRLQELVLQAEGRPEMRLNSFEGDICLLRTVRLAETLRRDAGGAIEFLHEFARGLAGLLQEHSFISDQAALAVIASGERMGGDIREHQRQPRFRAGDFSVDDLGLFGSSSNSIKLLTLHRAKGREFDAVAILGVDEGLIPYGTPASGSPQEAEGRRVFYVGVTRAPKLLMLVSSKNSRRRPSRFLQQINFCRG